jgi:voltage-gated sodium channel type II alpha
MIGNSISNHQDNRLEHELNHRGMSLQDDDTASIKSYGSHKNRPFKDESHKGSAETMEGEEKRDASKEDLGIDEGKLALRNLHKVSNNTNIPQNHLQN